jgi:hypothetical protein
MIIALLMAVMARIAEGLPIIFIPHERVVTLMRDDVVYYRSSYITTLLQVHNAKGVMV